MHSRPFPMLRGTEASALMLPPSRDACHLFWHPFFMQPARADRNQNSSHHAFIFPQALAKSWMNLASFSAPSRGIEL